MKHYCEFVGLSHDCFNTREIATSVKITQKVLNSKEVQNPSNRRNFKLCERTAKIRDPTPQ